MSENLEDVILNADYNYDRQYIRDIYPVRITYDDWQKIKRLAQERKRQGQERLK